MSTKVFQHFPLFPPELRMMMIDEMEPEDRCRFTRCSRSCSKEAKNSKKYLEGLELEAYDEMDWCVNVVYKQYKNLTQHGYSLKIEEISGTKNIIYRSLQTKKEVWRMEMNSLLYGVQFFIERIRYLLDLHQNHIKEIRIHVSRNDSFSKTLWKNYHFGIKQLNSLEGLIVNGIDIDQFISKIRRPLKKLQCSEASDTIMPYFDQISQVQDVLSISNLNLNYDQFLQLSARRINVNIGKMTEIDICNFINSWKNGEIRDNLKACVWGLRDSEFDVGKLFQLLGKELNNSDYRKIEIKHNKEVGKKAGLSYFEDSEDDRRILFIVERKTDGTSSS